MLRTAAVWAVVVVMWAAAVLFGIVAYHQAKAEPNCPFSVRERAVAFKFWYRRWTREECGPVLYWATIAASILALVVLVGMVVG